MAKGTPNDVKEYRAELMHHLLEAGVAFTVLHDANQKTSFPVGASTLRKHVRQFASDGHVLSPDNKAGAPQLLTDEQWHVVAGAILSAEERTHLVWVRDWIRLHYDTDMTLQSVSGWLKKLNITARSVVSRQLKPNITRNTYVKLYYDDVLELHNRGFFADMSKVVAHDSTSNSRRLERVTTLAMSGSKAKKMAAPGVHFTDLYMASIWGDGIARTPALMFTYDPTFKPNGPRWKEVKEWCRAWGIELWRIVYLEPPTKDATYVGAKKDLVGHFFNLYRDELAGCRMIHDAGGEYKKDKDYILADGAADHFVLRSETHGEVSPLDNRFFAIAKRWWRLERRSFCGDDVAKQNLYLLYCIDFVNAEQIQAQWNRNFLLEKEKLSLKDVDAMLAETTRLTTANQDREAMYLAAYDAFVQGGGLQDFPPQTGSLDGAYWK